MKARIPPHRRLTNPVLKLAEEYTRKNENDATRRMMKIWCTMLHRKYKFGKGRLNEAILGVQELCDESEKDTIFWYHIDEELKQIGMEFEDEPPEIQLGEDFI